jgi:hypothetical protein
MSGDTLYHEMRWNVINAELSDFDGTGLMGMLEAYF